MKLQKKVLKKHQILMGSWEKITSKRNYWSKDYQRNTENIYENTPKNIYRLKDQDIASMIILSLCIK